MPTIAQVLSAVHALEVRATAHHKARRYPQERRALLAADRIVFNRLRRRA